MSTDRQQIESTIQKYFDCIAKTDPKLGYEAFHPQATLSCHFQGDFYIAPNAAKDIEDYMKQVGPTSVHSPQFVGRIVRIEHYGTMASATVAEDQLEGKNMMTFLQLHKIDGQWRITAKATYAPD